MNRGLAILVAVSAGAVALGVGLSPSNIDPAHKFSWSENLGWMNWRDAGGTGGGVVVGLDFLSGMVWFENGGWMNVGDGAGPYANTTGTDFGVNVLANGDLDGFAWHENLGWANFGWAAGSGNPDRARLDVGNARFRGFAWTENDGWVNLDDETNYVGVENLCVPSSIAVAETLALPGSPESTKNRFLSFSAGDAGQTQGVRVTFVSLPPPFDVWDGAELWVGPTSQVSEAGADVIPTVGPTFTAATLRCTPLFTDWSVEGTVHVFHEGIVPNGNYRVEVIDEICDSNVATNFSAALPMTTPVWGDTVLNLADTPPAPPNGPPVDVVDALGVLGAFSSASGAIIKARADLEPACLDLKINVTDVLSSLAGFSGLDYPFSPTAPDPCDSACLNPLP